jgi:hypothetical protein
MAHSTSQGEFKTFQATAVAISAFRRVKVDSNGLISVASGTETAIGVVVEDVAASGYGTVQLFGCGTIMLTASAAIARGASLYATASGKVDDTGTHSLGYQSLIAATADGDIIECAPTRGQVAVPAPYASTDVGTIAAAGSAQGDATAIAHLVEDVTAGDGTKGVVLPAASAGLVYRVYNNSGSNLKVYPASGDDINDGTTDAAVTLSTKTVATFVALDSTTWAKQ